MDIPTQNNNSNIPEQKRFKNYLYNQVTFVIAVFGFAWSVFNYLNTPQVEFGKNIASMDKTISLIQQQMDNNYKNYQASIEDILNQVKQNQDYDRKQEEDIIRLLTIHNLYK